jgi:hypothetical protein
MNILSRHWVRGGNVNSTEPHEKTDTVSEPAISTHRKAALAWIGNCRLLSVNKRGFGMPIGAVRSLRKPFLCAIVLLVACSDTRTPEQLTGALFDAVVEGNCTEVSSLIEKGADPNGADHESGDLPLRIAGVRGHVKCVKVLLDAGADPMLEISGTSGFTRLTMRPLVSVQAAFSLLQSREANASLNRLLNPSGSRSSEPVVATEEYEAIISLLERAERDR